MKNYLISYVVYHHYIDRDGIEKVSEGLIFGEQIKANSKVEAIDYLAGVYNNKKPEKANIVKYSFYPIAISSLDED